jgi:uncharacterized iron-regulated protein
MIDVWSMRCAAPARNETKTWWSVNVMKKIIAVLGIAALLLSAPGCRAGQNIDNPRLYDLNREKELSMSHALEDLKKNKIVLVGELHANRQHHRDQLAVIRALKETGLRVAIGLEMFRHESQPALDQWISGEIDEQQLEKIYYDNWNFPWSTYRKIFEYARNHRIPMIGLNVPWEISRQVSRSGFKSLSPQQKGKITGVSCTVDQQYMNYIRKAFGSHNHGQLNFTYFCEAQMLWDSAMAVYSLAYLEKHPDTIMVILTGIGHAQKGAVPRQIRERSNFSSVVILPEIPGKIDPKTISNKEADYIMMDPD